MRHIRFLVGGSLVLAVLIVLLWPGSQLVLGLIALGLGVLLLVCVALGLWVVPRHRFMHPMHRPDAHH